MPTSKQIAEARSTIASIVHSHIGLFWEDAYEGFKHGFSEDQYKALETLLAATEQQEAPADLAEAQRPPMEPLSEAHVREIVRAAIHAQKQGLYHSETPMPDVYWGESEGLKKYRELMAEQPQPPLTEEDAEAIADAALDEHGLCSDHIGSDPRTRARKAAVAEWEKRQAARGQFSVGDRVDSHSEEGPAEVVSEPSECVRVRWSDGHCSWFPMRSLKVIPAEPETPTCKDRHSIYEKCAYTYCSECGQKLKAPDTTK